MAVANAQTNQSDTARWLEKAQIAPAFRVSESKAAWEKERKQIRKEVWELLGKLPPRPNTPKVQTVSREDRGDYVVEKFQFDNDAGATVPGYIIVPKNHSAKAPAILYCHWHGGEYDLGKEELFQSKHTPEEPGLAFAKRGYLVIGVDAYCFGERNGRGPTTEKGRDGELSALSGVPVLIEQGDHRASTNTNELGEFAFHTVPNGTLDLTITLNGYRFIVRGLSNQEPRTWRIETVSA